MDNNIDPCDDFFEFACGNFKKKTIIPDDENNVQSLSTDKNYAQLRFRTIFEEPSKPNDPRPFKLIKTFYESCMNESKYFN